VGGGEVTHDELIELIEAHRDGRMLEYKRSSDVNWRPIASDLGCLVRFVEEHYQVRVKPREVINEEAWKEFRYTVNEAMDEYLRRVEKR
jgi:hypothetical protein